MKKSITKGIVLSMLLILATAVFNFNGVTVNASTEVSIESNEKQSFWDKIKLKQQQKKEVREKNKRIKSLKSKIKKAKRAMKKGNYDLVIETLKPELENEQDLDISEAKMLCDIIEDYKRATSAFESKSYEEAIEILTLINSQYEDFRIKSDIDSLKVSVEKKLKEKAEINSKIIEVSTLIDEKKFNTAKSLIVELNKKELEESQTKTLEELNNTMNYIIEEERKAEERAKVEAAQAKARAEAEAERKRQEEQRKQQANLNKKPSSNTTTNNNSSNSSSSNNSGGTGSSNGTAYYIAPGNRYYHKTPGCKFLEGASTTQVIDVSNKFPCNCVKYN